MTDFLDASFRQYCVKYVRSMAGASVKGFYRYSLSGDILPEHLHWGLGNSVFAAKSLFMLNALSENDSTDMGDYISSFQDSSGNISDPFVGSRSRLRRWKCALRSFDFNNIANVQTIRAETRQAFAALLCLGKKPAMPYLHVPYTKEGIKAYVHALDWSQPWGAASHISHIVFFLHMNRVLFGVREADVDGLIDCALTEAEVYRQLDGSWHATGALLPLIHRVNAAMKMMTAYAAADRSDFESPEKLIDLCLAAANTGDACSNFNVICVLYYCNRKTDYRASEVRQYCSDRLAIYKKHYWLEYGGFSFHERRANDIYYWARISKGLPEPDIHGTVMFLWGISLISEIVLGPVKGGFKTPIV